MTLDEVNPAGVHAYTLVKALENVILPIVNAILPGIGELLACYKSEWHLICRSCKQRHHRRWSR
jgi:hypothetical protein